MKLISTGNLYFAENIILSYADKSEDWGIFQEQGQRDCGCS